MIADMKMILVGFGLIAMAFAAEDAWTKVKELKSGSEVRILKVGSCPSRVSNRSCMSTCPAVKLLCFCQPVPLSFRMTNPFSRLPFVAIGVGRHSPVYRDADFAGKRNA